MDEDLEMNICRSFVPENELALMDTVENYVDEIQRIRSQVIANALPVVIGRAAINGTKLIVTSNATMETCLDLFVRSRMTEDQWLAVSQF